MGSQKVRTFAPANEKDAPVAQLVEHLTLNQGVQGSSPCGCTRKETNESLSLFLCLIFCSSNFFHYFCSHVITNN